MERRFVRKEVRMRMKMGLFLLLINPRSCLRNESYVEGMNEKSSVMAKSVTTVELNELQRRFTLTRKTSSTCGDEN